MQIKTVSCGATNIPSFLLNTVTVGKFKINRETEKVERNAFTYHVRKVTDYKSKRKVQIKMT